MDLTVEAAARNSITIHDGSYISLAKQLGSVVYTADQQLLEGLRKEDRKLAKHMTGVLIRHRAENEDATIV